MLFISGGSEDRKRALYKKKLCNHSSLVSARNSFHVFASVISRSMMQVVFCGNIQTHSQTQHANSVHEERSESKTQNKHRNFRFRSPQPQSKNNPIMVIERSTVQYIPSFSCTHWKLPGLFHINGSLGCLAPHKSQQPMRRPRNTEMFWSLSPSCTSLSQRRS